MLRFQIDYFEPWWPLRCTQASLAGAQHIAELAAHKADVQIPAAQATEAAAQKRAEELERVKVGEVHAQLWGCALRSCVSTQNPTGYGPVCLPKASRVLHDAA